MFTEHLLEAVQCTASSQSEAVMKALLSLNKGWRGGSSSFNSQAIATAFEEKRWQASPLQQGKFQEGLRQGKPLVLWLFELRLWPVMEMILILCFICSSEILMMGSSQVLRNNSLKIFKICLSYYATSYQHVNGFSIRQTRSLVAVEFKRVDERINRSPVSWLEVLWTALLNMLQVISFNG